MGLLEAIPKRPVLWNNACADFMRSDKKADAWVAAKEEMSKEGKNANKKVIQNLKASMYSTS